MRSVLARRAPSPVVARASLAATAWAVGLLAWDHLWGNDRGPGDSFPVDPAAFLVTRGVATVAVALGLLAIVVATLATAFPATGED